MILMRSIVILVACMLLFCTSATAQTPDELRSDAAIAAERASASLQQITKELSLARRNGDVDHVRELELLLCRTMPSLPQEANSIILPPTEDGVPDAMSKTLWGHDVKIHTGPLYAHGKRQLAIDSDTLGGIYVALNAKYQDTLSYIRVYRSTNGGLNWSPIGGFYSSGHAVQSFDMCVTDSAAGKWLLGFAFIIKTDHTSGGGGSLYWGSMLSDGTSWRYTLIGAANASTCYRNPSICTDGTKYSPTVTYHYIASEYVTPATDVSRGLYITRTQNWGKTWVAPDTTVRGYQEATPVIAIDWSTAPDSLCLAFTRFASPSREIRAARNSLTFTSSWRITYPSGAKDDYDPAMAIDPVRGNAIITYTRATGAPTFNDAMYLYSADLFNTYTRDSIATSTANDELTAVTYAPWGTGYYWRVAYRSSGGSDTIYYKAILNKLSGMHSSAPYVVSQFQPTPSLTPAVGFDRDIGGTQYRGNCVYVGFGPQDVYFDAVDLALDVPLEEGLPTKFVLGQNYPNPFNPNSDIRYQISELGIVKLSVYDLLGREVAVLVNERKMPGTYTAKFEANGLASGVYFYRLQSENSVQTRKMMLMK